MAKLAVVIAAVGTIAFSASAFAGEGCFGAIHTAESSKPPVVAQSTAPTVPTTVKTTRQDG